MWVRVWVWVWYSTRPDSRSGSRSRSRSSPPEPPNPNSKQRSLLIPVSPYPPTHPPTHTFPPPPADEPVRELRRHPRSRRGQRPGRPGYGFRRGRVPRQGPRGVVYPVGLPHHSRHDAGGSGGGGAVPIAAGRSPDGRRGGTRLRVGCRACGRPVIIPMGVTQQ